MASLVRSLSNPAADAYRAIPVLNQLIGQSFHCCSIMNDKKDSSLLYDKICFRNISSIKIIRYHLFVVSIRQSDPRPMCAPTSAANFEFRPNRRDRFDADKTA